MFDENAFGILLSYFSIEDDEYAAEAAAFAARYAEFRRIVDGFVAQRAPAQHARGLLLGHAYYWEFPEEDILEPEPDAAQSASDKKRGLLAWVRELRAELSEFQSVAVLTHGGRWCADDSEGAAAPDGAAPGASSAAAVVSLPSEPLRRALYADTASQGVPEDDAAWGPGLYADTEALTALGLSPKNAPTPLLAAGATFFRLQR